MSLHVNLPTEAIATSESHGIACLYIEQNWNLYTRWCMSLYCFIALVNLQEHLRTFFTRVHPGCSASAASSLSGDGCLLTDVWPEWIEGAEKSFLDLWPVLSFLIAKVILILLHTVGETSVLLFS